ncbi:MAG: redoxin domain-containing protein [Deferribacteraceae bacterium]|jgi:peroxiredoxin|nr:redoxin domain-containing protein [Deferribacteraceae bacterium]
MAFPDFSRIRFFSLMKGRNLTVFILAAMAFWMLNKYRQNDPLPVSSLAPDFTMVTTDNQTFRLYDILTPVVLVFFSERKIFANNTLCPRYEKEMPYLKLLQEEGKAQIIILIKGVDTPEKLKGIYAKKNREYMENIAFAYYDPGIGKKFGVNSWPHAFILDSNHKVRYHTKILSSVTISKHLGGG